IRHHTSSHIHYLPTRRSSDLQSIKTDIFNLGIGEGLTVLEIIKAFEKTSGVKLSYSIGNRRPGDIEAIYADISKAKEILGWKPGSGVDEIMKTASSWEMNRSKLRYYKCETSTVRGKMSLRECFS